MPHTPRPRVALVAALLVPLLLAGCFRLVERDTYAIGVESHRANLVVHTRATGILHVVVRQAGMAATRKVILDRTPTAIPISARQRLVLCAISPLICLSAPQIGRTLMSWFRDDVRRRPDLGDAVREAARDRRCLAWTFLPRRNFTHKGRGTSGCTSGLLP